MERKIMTKLEAMMVSRYLRRERHSAVGWKGVSGPGRSKSICELKCRWHRVEMRT